MMIVTTSMRVPAQPGIRPYSLYRIVKRNDGFGGGYELRREHVVGLPPVSGNAEPPAHSASVLVEEVGLSRA